MGELQIKDKQGNWSEVFNASNDEIIQMDINGVVVNITTVETELKCYALMSRWSTYHKLKQQISKSSQDKLF